MSAIIPHSQRIQQCDFDYWSSITFLLLLPSLYIWAIPAGDLGDKDKGNKAKEKQGDESCSEAGALSDQLTC
ncbi:hypothetical protein P691DRAFT_769048 [Macrolepiota fuliginosa MF-IS2]|uniref:Uncharacterized protein n=1 Tax=Macrolepiota fuliginosa MF-IS2 TaxID=1400762 RepID=A0A9P5WWV2_9AGAR|nr:hypothetical protein P691DRAFT_769048 [Macrolepiota fuliginosa MF-IS2]